MKVDVFIEGVPYGQKKVRGDTEAMHKWTNTIEHATRTLPKIKGPCSMTVSFVLPEDKYPADLPYGSDLDNLMKRLLDALGSTIFAEAPGLDSVVVEVNVSKRMSSWGETTGAKVTIQEIDGYDSVSDLDKAYAHSLAEVGLANIRTSLEIDYDMIQRAHDSIHEMMLLAALSIESQTDASWLSRSAFLTYQWEAFHQAHRSLLEALSGYYNSAFILLRSTLELLLKGAFWECLAHKDFRENAAILSKGKGNKKSVKHWIDDLIREMPSLEQDLEETSAVIFDRTAIIFEDHEFCRQYVHMPPFSDLVEQLIRWGILDVPDPFRTVYDRLYRKLSADVHVTPDATDVGRRLLHEEDFLEIEVIPHEVRTYMRALHEVVDIGIVVELNVLRDWIEKRDKAKLRSRLSELQILGLESGVEKLRYLIT